MKIDFRYKSKLRGPRPHISTQEYFPPWIKEQTNDPELRAALAREPVQNLRTSQGASLRDGILSGITYHDRPATFRFDADIDPGYSVSIDRFPTRRGQKFKINDQGQVSEA